MSLQDILDIDPNEKIIFNEKRHPIGMIEIFLGAFAAIAMLLGAMYFVINKKADVGLEDFGNGIIMLVFGAVIVFIFAIAAIAIKIYRTNQLVLTNENILQILQFGLFNRQISQLNLAKIQDVSADKVGILASMFSYGTVEIETAGEAANFRFTYARNPDRLSKQIIEAHEQYVHNRQGPQSPSGAGI